MIDPPTFFIDRAIGRYIFPSILRKAGISIQVHDDVFDRALKDVEWIPMVADRGWYAVSMDRRIYINNVERSMVLNSGLGYFVLSGGSKPMAEKAQQFVNSYKQILKFINRYDRPFIASITKPAPKKNNVNLLYPRRK